MAKKEFNYHDRKTKAQYVYNNFKSILDDSVLDVGADECYLKEYLHNTVLYTGIGLGSNPNLLKLDLEKEKLPFNKDEYSTVICLDVLEHLDNIHDVFDSLCFVAKKWVLITLPNPYNEFMLTLENRKYRQNRNLKFYGLPLVKENDRHKWFFSSREAIEFVRYRSQLNNFKIKHIDIENKESIGHRTKKSLANKLFSKYILKKIVFRKAINFSEYYEGMQWYLLENQNK